MQDVKTITMNSGLRIMNLMRNFPEHKKQEVANICKDLIREAGVLESISSDLHRIESSLMSEIRSSVKTNPFKPIQEQEYDVLPFKDAINGTNLIHLSSKITNMFLYGYKEIANILFNTIPDDLLSSQKTSEDVKIKSTDDLKDYLYEFQLNEGQIKKYAQSIFSMHEMSKLLADNIDAIYNNISNYYSYLKDKHQTRNVKIYSNALITDVAYSIFQNIDAHGEIASGTELSEISSYTINKGITCIECTKNAFINDVMHNSDYLIQFIKEHARKLNALINKANDLIKTDYDSINSIIGSSIYSSIFDSFVIKGQDVEYNLQKLADVNPSSVRYKEGIITQDERFAREFEEKTIESIVEFINNKAGAKEILNYIFERKSALKKHFQEENTFYVCQISQGNPFLGEAPGALKVIPGKRPNIGIHEIVGSGFDGIREFYASIEAGSKWGPLFIATSPSKSADKANCLLVGPPGSGKTEIMRAIGGHKDCIGIFAQGSDFLTCWKGEADKNPKRLFEQALTLHKESKKRVYILIDEVDSVMHHPEGMNDTNLTLEFQILMDGIVSYPGISVWGATNNPERIPMAMIRRFNRVEIVGELSENDRIHLLKQFLDYMPHEDFTDTEWKEHSEALVGATGDVIRQVCDHIWRTKIYSFINANEENADRVMKNMVGKMPNGFSVQHLDEDKRTDFKKDLHENGLCIKPKDVKESISIHLKNIAVRSEIDTAVQTYATAKAFLKQLEPDNQDSV